MKAESLLKQDSSLLKQDSSLLKQDSSLLKQDSSLLKQDSMVAWMTMTQICLKMMMERNRIEDLAQIKLNDS